MLKCIAVRSKKRTRKTSDNYGRMCNFQDHWLPSGECAGREPEYTREMSSLASAATQVRDAVGLGHEGDSTPGEPPWWDTSSWPTATLLRAALCGSWERCLPRCLHGQRKLLLRKAPKRLQSRFQGQKLSRPPEWLTYFSPRHMRQQPVLVPLLCWWRKLNDPSPHSPSIPLFPSHLSVTKLSLSLVYFSYSYFFSQVLKFYLMAICNFSTWLFTI